MQNVNTKILKENQNLRNELKELTSITETWLNSSHKVNQCISEQIPTQKKKILGIVQLTKDTFSSGPKDPVFIKSSADNSDVSNTGSNKPKLSEAKDSTLPNYYPADKSLVCSTLLPPLEKLVGAKLVFGPKTIKLNLKSNPTFKAETLKDINLKEPSSTPAKDNKKGSSASKTFSAPARKTDHRTCDHVEFMSSIKTSQHHTGHGESSLRSRPSRPIISFPSCIHCGYNDHQSDDYVYYPICELCESYDHDTHNHNRIIFLRRGIKPRNPQRVIKNYETCGSNVHTITDHNNIKWFRKGEAKKAEANKTVSSNVQRSKTPLQRWVSKQN
ncbi:hypothetical protein Tco_0573920 [Tanacetum coccineum]